MTPSSNTEANQAPANQQVIFLVKNIRANGRHALSNLKIAMMIDNSNLFQLVSLVFEHGLQKLCKTHDATYSHLWGVSYNKVQYNNGWRTPANRGGVSKHHIDEQEPRSFADLKVAKGHSGSFRGESGSFDFCVESVTDTIEGDENTSKGPVVKLCKLQLTCDVACDFLSDELKTAAMRLRVKYEQYYSGENAWKRDRRTRKHIPCKPLAPTWERNESEIVGLLINSDAAKFKKSWTSILQYALVDRPEPASSGCWYKLRGKESYKLDYVGKGLSKQQMVVAAKRLCIEMLEKQIARGVPKTQRKPLNAYERALLESCMDSDYESDTATPVAKRAKIEDMKARHSNGELEEAVTGYLDHYKRVFN